MDNVTNIEPADNEERLLKGILEGDTETNIEPAGNKERLLKAILEKGGGKASWETTVTMGFAVGTDTATIGGTTYVKTSDKYFTDEQLVGAAFHMGGDSITITEEMLVDMSTYGVDATGINLPNFGMVVFCAHSADETIPSTGTYLVQAMSSYAPAVTISYTDTIEAKTLPIAYGTTEFEDGVTEMPDGVVYLQLE